MPESLLPLTGEVLIRPDAEELFFDLGRALMGAACAAVTDHGVFHLALSGGSTPEPFYVRLVTDPAFRGLPWDKTHVWIVDERRVPEDDQRSNYRMIRESLLDHVPMRTRQKHPMPVLAGDPAGAYEGELRQVIGGSARADACVPKLDFVLLGVGGDGHTASLFPQSDGVRVTDRLVTLNDGAHVTPPPRVTMTFPLLNAARQVAVLATGGKKARILRRVSDQLKRLGPDPLNLPITGVNPADPELGDGALTWYLDAESVEG